MYKFESCNRITPNQSYPILCALTAWLFSCIPRALHGLLLLIGTMAGVGKKGNSDGTLLGDFAFTYRVADIGTCSN